MNWNTSAGNNINFTTDGTDTLTFATTTNTLWFLDPLVDWLPNSCLYVKYIPTWHLVKSYPKHNCESAWFDEDQGIYDWYCKYCKKVMVT